MISAQKAHALAEAGFFQPEFAFGQMWYDKSGNLYVVTDANENGAKMADNLGGTWNEHAVDAMAGNLFYAPTMEDLSNEVCMSENTDILADIWLSRQTQTA